MSMTLSTGMTIAVDRDRCAGNAVCMVIAPDMFDYDDETGLAILIAHPDADRVEDAREAVNNCPMAALTLLKTTGDDA